MDSVEPAKFAGANGDGRPISPLLVELREWLAGLDGVAPEQLVCGVWGPRDGLCVVVLSGEMDMANAAELGEALGGRFGVGPCHVVVEMSGLTFIDSTGIHQLVRLAKLTMATAGTTVLATPTPHVAQVLELVEFGKVAAIVGSLEAAVAHLNQGADFDDARMLGQRVVEGSNGAIGARNEPS